MCVWFCVCFVLFCFYVLNNVLLRVNIRVQADNAQRVGTDVSTVLTVGLRILTDNCYDDVPDVYVPMSAYTERHLFK